MEGTPCPIIQVTDEGVKHLQPQYEAWGYTTSNWPPAAFDATNHKIFS